MTKEQFENILAAATMAGEDATANMTDGFPCGGAYHKAAGNSPIIKAFKKFGEYDGHYYKVGNWRASKDVYTGYVIFSPHGNYQNMDMHAACVTAQSGVLGVNNLITTVHAYID